MKIYTSYFANGARLHKAGIMMIGIALYPPKWFEGPSIKIVSPSWDILHNSNGEEDYTKRFETEILARRDPKTVMAAIEHLANGKDVALCCFEKPNDFCHRHIVAKWLNEKLGLEVSEYTTTPVQTYVEPSLF